MPCVTPMYMCIILQVMGKPKSPRSCMREYRERIKNSREKKEVLEKDR